MAERAIFIRLTAGDQFAVTVEPPLEAPFDTFWPTHKSATSYAGMLRRLRDLPLVDETEGGAA